MFHIFAFIDICFDHFKYNYSEYFNNQLRNKIYKSFLINFKIGIVFFFFKQSYLKDIVYLLELNNYLNIKALI